MLSYATYIGATIYARIVAQKGSNSTAFQSLVLCRNILVGHTRIYAAAGKARDNLDKLTSHLGIDMDDNECFDRSEQSVPRGNLAMEETVNVGGEMGLVDREFEFGSSLMNLELSDLDLEAIAQGFQLDMESHLSWHSLGV